MSLLSTRMAGFVCVVNGRLDGWTPGLPGCKGFFKILLILFNLNWDGGYRKRLFKLPCNIFELKSFRNYLCVFISTDFSPPFWQRLWDYFNRNSLRPNEFLRSHVGCDTTQIYCTLDSIDFHKFLTVFNLRWYCSVTRRKIAYFMYLTPWLVSHLLSSACEKWLNKVPFSKKSSIKLNDLAGSPAHPSHFFLLFICRNQKFSVFPLVLFSPFQRLPMRFFIKLMTLCHSLKSFQFDWYFLFLYSL